MTIKSARITALILILAAFAQSSRLAVAQDGPTIEQIQQLANQGDGQAQYDLGRIYHLGAGVSVDSAAAATWYRKAAEQGIIQAQVRLGALYTLGMGVPQSDAEATKWFRKAADRGDVDAQGLLGVQYEAGSGVPKNYVEAYKWHVLADRSGDSAEFLDKLAKNMTPAEIAVAQKLARDWKPESVVQTSKRSAAANLDVDEWKVLACTIEKPSSDYNGAPITFRFKESGEVLENGKQLRADISADEISFTNGDLATHISRVTGRFARLNKGRLVFTGPCVLAATKKF